MRNFTISKIILRVLLSSAIILSVSFISNQVWAMQILIKTPSLKLIPLNVEPSDTISSVKAKIQALESIATNHQHLSFNGKLLEDNRTISDYQIKNASVILLVLHLR